MLASPYAQTPATASSTPTVLTRVRVWPKKWLVKRIITSRRTALSTACVVTWTVGRAVGGGGQSISRPLSFPLPEKSGSRWPGPHG